jgi:hypothetical protein
MLHELHPVTVDHQSLVVPARPILERIELRCGKSASKSFSHFPRSEVIRVRAG